MIILISPTSGIDKVGTKSEQEITRYMTTTHIITYNLQEKKTGMYKQL